MRLSDKPTDIPPGYSDKLMRDESAKRLLSLPLYYMDYPLSYGSLRVEYPEGAEAVENSELKLKISVGDSVHVCTVIKLRWRHLPEGWFGTPSVGEFMLRSDCFNGIQMNVQVGGFTDSIEYLELEVFHAGRRVPEVIFIPVQQKNAINLTVGCESERSYRCRTRIVERDANEVVENPMPQL